ncbi:MAG TPA: DMT family transporter [Paenalcaligenes sp.]|nr:DMT family transporter [Paenalcaligenes sp.]
MNTTHPIAGILILVLSTWALSTLDASGKWVMAAGISLFFMVWVRYIVHLVLVMTIVIPLKGWRVFKAKQPGMQLLRGVVMLLATYSFFTALSYLPQAEATAINFLAPLLMLAAAPWVLHEPPHISRWIAAIVGFIGVLIIIRPGSGLHPVGVMFGLITACMFATQFIVTRKVAIDDSMTTLLWSGLVGSVLTTLSLPYAFSAALPVLKGFSGMDWVALFATGVFGALGHLLQIQAYQRAPASLLAPFVYLQIVSAAGLGWLIWGQFPDALTWLGIFIICSSGITIGFIEWRRSRRPIKKSPATS